MNMRAQQLLRRAKGMTAVALLVLVTGCADGGGGAACAIGFATTVVKFTADIVATATGQDQPYDGYEISDPTDEYCND